MPLGIPPWERNGVNSVRFIGVTPARVSSNSIISAIVDDVARCSSEGIPVSMPDGTSITLFVDVVGYVGDYQAMVHLLDVTGVNGVAPCNFCTFHRANVGSTERMTGTTHEKSCYAYSSTIHSGNLSFRRTKARMAQFRNNTRPSELKRVGLRGMTDIEVSALPLHTLSDALESVKHKVPELPNGDPVVPCVFDPYMGCLVAPDHLFFGLGQDVAQTMFFLLRPAERKRVNELATEALAMAGHGRESSLLNPTSYQIHQMSFTSFFAYLLVILWAVRVTLGFENIPINNTGNEQRISLKYDVLRALFHFQRLFVKATYVPRAEIDGIDAVKRMEAHGRESHIYEVQSL